SIRRFLSRRAVPDLQGAVRGRVQHFERLNPAPRDDLDARSRPAASERACNGNHLAFRAFYARRPSRFRCEVLFDRIAAALHWSQFFRKREARWPIPMRRWAWHATPARTTFARPIARLR